jgi:prolyl oligopeptidase
VTVLPSAYPPARRDDAVVDTLHGRAVPDPYRWLEDPDSPETAAFVRAQNVLSRSVLDAAPAKAAFAAAMEAAFDFPKFGSPTRRGGRFYFSFNPGLANQAALLSVPSLAAGAPTTTLLDPNALSKDGTVAVSDESFSDDGRHMSYQVSSGGSDWRTVKVMAVDPATGTGTPLADELRFVKFSGEAWTKDSLGFFYARFPAPAGVVDLGTETASAQGQELWYHVAGTGQERDVKIISVPDHPDWSLGATVTDDGGSLLVSLSRGTAPANRLWLLDLGGVPATGPGGALDFSAAPSPLPVRKIVDAFDFSVEYVATRDDGSVVLLTNAGAPRYRLVHGTWGAAATTPLSSWPDLVPQHPRHLLQWARAAAGDALLVGWLADVVSVVELRSLATGALVRTASPGGIGTAAGVSVQRNDALVSYAWSSFIDPGTVYVFDTSTPSAAPTVFRRTAVKGHTPTDFVTTQEWAVSADGTRVPFFVTAKKAAARDSNRPTLLYGYGGFNIAVTPSFSVSRALFMAGFDGAYASANMRGGGEYGTAWRDAGSGRNKQRVFDDFQAVAERLIALNWTAPARLAIQGGSNGGTLVAACVNQRPDLYAAGVAQVGVHDMARFPRFTIGHAWRGDFGDPADAGDWATMAPWSPLHNVSPPPGGSRNYPAMLLTTGDHDDRVPPLHSFKLAATLQHALAGWPASPQRNPLLLRVETRAGHGAGKPTSKQIEETADVYGFLSAVFGAPWTLKETGAEA